MTKDYPKQNELFTQIEKNLKTVNTCLLSSRGLSWDELTQVSTKLQEHYATLAGITGNPDTASNIYVNMTNLLPQMNTTLPRPEVPPKPYSPSFKNPAVSGQG